MLSWTLIDRQHSYSIFPGEKRKNTSMNSLNLLWTFVGFQKLDWISLETSLNVGYRVKDLDVLSPTKNIYVICYNYPLQNMEFAKKLTKTFVDPDADCQRYDFEFCWKFMVMI